MSMYFTGDINSDLALLIEAAHRVSADVEKEVEAILHETRHAPLTEKELRRLLTTIITVVKKRADERGDEAILGALAEDTEALVQHLIDLRNGRAKKKTVPAAKRLKLVAHKGINCGPILPTPVFHGKE